MVRESDLADTCNDVCVCEIWKTLLFPAALALINEYISKPPMALSARRYAAGCSGSVWPSMASWSHLRTSALAAASDLPQPCQLPD